MGHNLKTANRAAAIARNTERYRNLAAKVGELEKEDRALRKALALEVGRRRMSYEALADRLERLERPLRRKVADYLVTLYSKVKAKLKRTPEQTPEQTPEHKAEALTELDPVPKDIERPPELEIVEPPKEATDAERRHAAELVSPPPAGGMATASLELEAQAESADDEKEN